MDGFVKKARERINKVNKANDDKVEMKKEDFDKLVNKIGREIKVCPVKEKCPEFYICEECWRQELLQHIKTI